MAQMGLLAAMDSMKNELMLLGFATLLLLTLEPKIEKICVRTHLDFPLQWILIFCIAAMCTSRV
jgi:hypothetical protein